MNSYCIDMDKGITRTNTRVHHYNHSKLVINLPREEEEIKKEEWREVPE